MACTFCAIVSGDLLAAKVLEDELTVAFLDARPLFHGHVLLVPRAHVETLPDLPPDAVGPFFARAQELSVAVRDAMEAAGTFVAINNVVSQSVPHLHCHIVPRRFKDGLRGFFWPRTKYAERDAVAEAIASRLASR